MTAINKVFLDDDNFYQRIVGTYLTAIVLKPLLLDVSHGGTIESLEEITLQGVQRVEVAFSGYDALINVGKYCFNPTTNSCYILVDSTTVTSDTLAKDYIRGILVKYQVLPIKYYSDTDLYEMSTSYSNGVFVGSTNPTTFDVISSKIAAYDNDINVNQIGWYEHTIKRAIVAS